MSAAKINYLRQGSGSPPIVFVHGFLCRHVVLERVADVTSETIPAGHFSMLEIPELINAGIEHFIAEKIS